ncbi:MAG: hypothetical protein LBU72_02315, partial [Burkholderiaceae bacterium]|nr:hypothetical protein [Burkholderiaceae bacterium]
SVSGSNGTISPATAVSVKGTATTACPLKPSAGYVGSGAGTCGGTLSGNTFTTSAITKNCTVVAKFAKGTYIVTPSVSGSNGTISPATAVSVKGTATTSFTLKPSAGYVGSVAGTCGGTLSGNTFTTKAIIANCTVTATFAQVTYTVTASAGSGGAINPSGAVLVAPGATKMFTAVASLGYKVSSIDSTCGGTFVPNNYTTKPITTNCTVTASFIRAYPLVTISVSAGGSVSANGYSTINGPDTSMIQVNTTGGVVSLIATPNPGYATVIPFGGTCPQSNPVYIGDVHATDSITSDCTIIVTFAPASYTVMSSMTCDKGYCGTFEEGGPQNVISGETVMYEILASSGYSVSSVGGTCGGGFTSLVGPRGGPIYKTNPIMNNCTVVMNFSANK